jgi:hypothetical protein
MLRCKYVRIFNLRESSGNRKWAIPWPSCWQRLRVCSAGTMRMKRFWWVRVTWERNSRPRALLALWTTGRAAFDNDPRTVGECVHGNPVLSLECLIPLAGQRTSTWELLPRRRKPRRRWRKKMAKAGIQAIWNFAPVKLNLPESVIVQNEDLYSSWASLSCKLARRLRVQLEKNAGLN